MKEKKLWLYNQDEQIKETRKNDGNKAAQKTFRLLVTLTLLLSIVIGMSACGADTFFDDSEQGFMGEADQYRPVEATYYRPVETTRSPEEIQATGLTANDVLAAYDELARDSYDAFNGVLHDAEGKKVYEHIITFDSISPISMEFNDGNTNFIPLQCPYYYKESQFCPFYAWFRDENSMFYQFDRDPTTNENLIIPNAYLTSFNISYTNGNKIEERPYPFWAIPNNMMRKLMKAFGASEFKITEELASNSDYPHSVYEIAMDQKVFEGITITREDVQNATPEQLEVLMEALPYMYSCNFYCQLPDGETNYNFEIE